VMVFVEFEPTCTLPKLKLDGFAPSAPAVTPVPASAMFKRDADALSVSARLPVADAED